MMPTRTQPVLGDALEYLTALANDVIEPEIAQAGLRELREQYPDVRFRLLWQREEFDGSLQYDLLIRGPGEGVVSLSHSPDQVLPWPLRGRHRNSEKVLLRVDGANLLIEQAVACLDFIWEEPAVADRLIDVCMLRALFEEDPVVLSEDELQESMDSFRRARRLFTAAATDEWMRRHGLSHQNLEELVFQQASAARLRQGVVAGAIEQYLDEHQRDLDSARIVRLTFPSVEAAASAAARIATGKDFYSVAETSYTDRQTTGPTLRFETVRRADLAPGVAEAVFGAEAGTVLGPLPAEQQGHMILRVLGIEPAVFDEDTILEAERRLFAAWLDERRRSAHIEWFWGNASRSSETDPGRHCGGEPAPA